MKEFRFMNYDLSFEVFSRLSTKDLHLLKFVSKEWGRLISDPSFIRLHLRKKEIVSGFFFQERYDWYIDDIDRISYLPLEAKRKAVHNNVLNFLPESVVVLDSWDGLICCRSTLSANDPKLYICNPLNKEWTSLEWLNPSKEKTFALVFDKSSSRLGDDAPLEFKVVAVSEDESGSEEECEVSFDVYSSGNKTWKRSNEICRSANTLISKKGVCVNGSFYCLTKGDQVVMYDPILELSWLINVPLPASEFRMLVSQCIGDSNGKLHYVVFSENGLQLWLLEDPFLCQWNTMYTFTINELAANNPEFLRCLASHFSTYTTAEMALWIDTLAYKDGILFIRVATYLYFFYFETGKLKKLCPLSELGDMSINSPIVIPYTMSLVPLVSD